MLFNSVEFIFLFLPIVLMGFFLLAHFHKQKTAIVWLVAASLFFYGYWNPIYLFLLIFSKGFNYGIGLIIAHHFSRFPVHKKAIFILGIIGNLALLGYYKYANFFVNTLDQITGLNWQIEEIILPLGISFFTFQNIAYLVDIYTKREVAKHSFLEYALFVSFFPQLIAGPIVHHLELIPQFEKTSTFKFNHSNFIIGLTIFIIGLAKKVIIADSISIYATGVFDASKEFPVSFVESWIGVLSYTLQLYFDFSGYSDMAIGIARMFGVKLPLNFNSPYKAISIADFWHRWHITLSRFLRTYLYIPLGGNRLGELRRYSNLIITMLLGGLWHGAGWTFIFWGGLHGVGLSIHRLWNQLCQPVEKYMKIPPILGKKFAQLVTLLFVMISWVFFRAETLLSSFNMLKGITGINGVPEFWEKLAFLGKFGIKFTEAQYAKITIFDAFFWIVVAIFVTFLLPNTQEWMGQHQPALDYKDGDKNSHLSKFWQPFQWQPTPRFAMLIGGLVFLIFKVCLTAQRNSEFLYFNF